MLLVLKVLTDFYIYHPHHSHLLILNLLPPTQKLLKIC